MKNWRNVTENACWVGKRTPKTRPTFRKHIALNYSLLFGKRHLAQCTALNQACAFPAQRCHRKQDVIQDASLGKREEFQFVCAYVGEGRTGGVTGQQTPARHCPGFISSSIKTVCSVNCKLNKIPHLEQNSEYQLRKKPY